MSRAPGDSMESITFDITEVAGYQAPQKEPSGCDLCGHCRMLRQSLARLAERPKSTGHPTAAVGCGDRP